MKLLRVLWCSNFINAHFFSQLAEPLEGDQPVDFGVERIVLSYPYIVPGMDLCALLAYQNAAGTDQLAPVPLYAESLTRTVSTVSGASSRFFVCHGESLKDVVGWRFEVGGKIRKQLPQT